MQVRFLSALPSRWTAAARARRPPLSDILPAAFFEAIPIGCVVVDASGKILQANSFAAERLRRSSRGLVGEEFFQTFGLPDGKAAFAAGRRAGVLSAALTIDLDVPDAVVRVRGFANGGDTYALIVFEPAHPEARMRRLSEAWETALATVREVRHEINNPLMGILGQLELLRGRDDLPPQVVQKLASIERESDRIRTMTAKLGTIKRL